ncbi:MAG: glycerol-3-phosphate acyltransferase [Candidatus Metalachnospira sp.]|nr:glycerol-3-phosphate acyltransferase [Candidatus Metalachnospira sp.]
MFRVACLVIGYFIGCIQTAYFVGKAYNVDISKTGSGNLGTTNTVRALGIKAGLFTFWCDVAKSLAAFLICKAVFKTDPIVAGFYGSAGAIIGHDFPFFHKFKGGKGIATMVGMMFGTFPFPALIVFIIALTILLSGYVSVTSLALAVMIPISLHICGYPSEAVWVTIALAVLAFLQHRQNIKRLINGTESRFDIIGKLKPKKKER